MKEKRFAVEQIVAILKKAELGVPIGGVDPAGGDSGHNAWHNETNDGAKSCPRLLVNRPSLPSFFARGSMRITSPHPVE
jgi:hypothetical protein